MPYNVAVAGIAVAVPSAALILARRRVRSTRVRCAHCGRSQRMAASRKETFTCKHCKNTLPRRFAEPVDD